MTDTLNRRVDVPPLGDIIKRHTDCNRIMCDACMLRRLVEEQQHLIAGLKDELNRLRPVAEHCERSHKH